MIVCTCYLIALIWVVLIKYRGSGMAQTLHCLYGVETCSSAASLPKDPKLPAIMKLMLIEYLTRNIIIMYAKLSSYSKFHVFTCA